MFFNNPNILKHSLHSLPLSRSFTTFQKKLSPYEILGVRPNATLFDIKKAYYTKAQLFHPDINKGPEAEAAFKQITKAYETLKNPLSRQIYDLHKTDHSFTADYDQRYNQASTSTTQYKHQEASFAGRTDINSNMDMDVYAMDKNNNTVIVNNKGSVWLKDLFTKAVVVLGVVFAYNYWQKQRKGKKKYKEATEAQKANAIGRNAVGELVYESPLVFVREKPVDPVKLQEEMKQKQFRIEYAEQKTLGKPVKKFRVKEKGESSGSMGKVIGLEEFMNQKNIGGMSK